MASPSELISREWQAPPWNATESRKLGWLNESCQEGANWNKSQRGYDDWQKGLEILSGRCNEKEVLQYRSQLSGNRLKTNIRVAVAGMAAIRPWGGFQSKKSLSDYATMMNQTTRALYLAGYWDQCIKEALQWAAATNTGWLRPVYRRDMAGRGHGNIELDSFGTPSVLPVQMPSSGNYQRAYCVNLLDEKPIWEAHGMFPDHQDRLKPTSSRYWHSSDIRKASRDNQRRSWWNPFKRPGQSEGAEHLIPFRYTTINDLSINNTGTTIPMGEQGSPWAYDVPSLGEEIPLGGGKYRKATINDARMYPFRRLMISSETVCLYDGPAFNWHGELDLIPFCLDKWPWEPFGFSMFHDGWQISKAIDSIDRGVMDKIIADMDRPLGYDINAVTKREANVVDLMQPRQRVGFDGSQVDKPFTQIAPDDVYKISPQALEFRKELQADLDYTLQTRDIVELGKARALGKGMDQLEALIAASGPLVKDMSRSIEKSIGQLANQVKYLILQFMDTARLIPYITEAAEATDAPDGTGRRGGVESVFDYDPSTLVPSHLPGEPPMDANGQALASPTSRTERARWFAQNLEFVQTPHSAHEIHQMTYRLGLMQMRARGFHIAECDILEANDVPDVKRAVGSTTQDRFWDEKREEAEETAKMQKIVEGLGIDVEKLIGGGGGKQKTGRPPSGGHPPEVKTKDGGTRSTITESK